MVLIGKECCIVPGLQRSIHAPITAIPYYAWDNRAPGEMWVWLQDAR